MMAASEMPRCSISRAVFEACRLMLYGRIGLDDFPQPSRSFTTTRYPSLARASIWLFQYQP